MQYKNFDRHSQGIKNPFKARLRSGIVIWFKGWLAQTQNLRVVGPLFHARISHLAKPGLGVIIYEMTATLLFLSILLPIIAGILSLVIRNYKIRTVLVFLTALVLVVSTVLYFTALDLPIKFTPSAVSGWETIITILNFAIMAFFIVMAILDIVQRGISKHNILALLLTLAAGIPLAIFEFGFGSQAEVETAFYIDHLSLALLLVISVVGSLICIFALKYMRDHEAHRQHAGELKGSTSPRFFFFLLVFLGVMNGLVFSNNLLWMAFFWEVTTLCCWGLIRHDGTDIAKTNALRALWMCLIGSTAISLAIILFWNSDLNSISLLDIVRSHNLLNNPALYLPLAFLVMAAFTKSAQVPFQPWLLGAMVAPTPVSALLHSSTMVNAGVYLLLRLAPAYQGTSLSTFIAVYGGMVFMVTSLIAISQTNAKKVLAYSTIANLGLIVLLAGINTPLSIACGIMLLIFHAVSKALLFLSTGTIEHYIWSREIEDMEGLYKKMPVLAGITIAGILSMIAAPFGVIISKWGGFEATSSMSTWSALILLMLVIGSSATTVFWAKWSGRLLCNAPDADDVKPEKMTFLYHGVLIGLVGLAAVFSLLVIPLFNNLISPGLSEAGYDITQAFTSNGWALKTSVGIIAAWPLFIVMSLAIFIPAMFIKIKPGQAKAAYMSGENLDVSDSKFTSVGDAPTDLKTAGMYLEPVFGEKRITRFIIPLGIAMLVILLVMALL
jgi:ech hydrogenase subunit A